MSIDLLMYYPTPEVCVYIVRKGKKEACRDLVIARAGILLTLLFLVATIVSFFNTVSAPQGSAAAKFSLQSVFVYGILMMLAAALTEYLYKCLRSQYEQSPERELRRLDYYTWRQYRVGIKRVPGPRLTLAERRHALFGLVARKDHTVDLWAARWVEIGEERQAAVSTTSAV